MAPTRRTMAASLGKNADDVCSASRHAGRDVSGRAGNLSRMVLLPTDRLRLCNCRSVVECRMAAPARAADAVPASRIRSWLPNSSGVPGTGYFDRHTRVRLDRWHASGLHARARLMPAFADRSWRGLEMENPGLPTTTFKSQLDWLDVYRLPALCSLPASAALLRG